MNTPFLHALTSIAQDGRGQAGGASLLFKRIKIASAGEMVGSRNGLQLWSPGMQKLRLCPVRESWLQRPFINTEDQHGTRNPCCVCLPWAAAARQLCLESAAQRVTRHRGSCSRGAARTEVVRGAARGPLLGSSQEGAVCVLSRNIRLAVPGLRWPLHYCVKVIS